ncbi:hypothetical protein EM595_p0332 (plasmid) [Duffyella gerundensis]|uniref:Uncharacterized protein n=1 Tax=Duffyella gerundensis TaxID=1619313 RepID=A0A0U5L6H6_9GAMM|nr:hypothetical protein EM595_p0332 [Duffyella gerundensis]
MLICFMHVKSWLTEMRFKQQLAEHLIKKHLFKRLFFAFNGLTIRPIKRHVMGKLL